MINTGGDSGGTPWATLPMDQIQHFAQSPDIDAHYKLVDGWQKSIELVSEHLSQVTSYRDGLAAAWPPEKSPASAQYLARLDELIKHLQDTSEAAIVNGDAMSGATGSLNAAKAQVSELYSTWQSNQNSLAAYTAAQTGPTPNPTYVGTEPPVTAAQQEDLRQKAANIMQGVSTDLAQAQLKIVKPAEFAPSLIGYDEKHQVFQGTDAAPVVPPIVPVPFVADGSDGPNASSKRSGSATSTAGAARSSTSPTTHSSSPASSSGNHGVILGGTHPQSSTLPQSTGSHAQPVVPGEAGRVTLPSTVPPSGGSRLPRGLGVDQPTRTSRLPGDKVPSGSGGLPGSGGEISPGSARPSASGGVINGARGGILGEPIEGRMGLPRVVNPVGGVIGGSAGGGFTNEPRVGEAQARSVGSAGSIGAGGFGGAGSQGGSRVGGRTPGPYSEGTIGGRPSAAATSTEGLGAERVGMRGAASQQPFGQLGGRQSGRRSESERKRWDPDNPWEVEQGVEPVIMPAPEQKIDPGPAIGL